MSYATLQDLIERAGQAEILQVADRDGDDVADTDVVAAAIATAGETVDAYLGGRYVLPLASTPPMVKRWAVSIARYTLHRDGAPDHVVRDYRDTIAALKDAQAGRISLPDLAGVAPAQAGGGGGIGVTGPEPVFTREGLEGWL